MICHQAWFVRRSYYLSYGDYETKFPSGADYRYLLRMILQNQVVYKHVHRVLIVYKGGGLSQNPKNIIESAAWRDEARESLFCKYELILYAMVRGGRNMLKKMAYDPFLYKVFATLRKKKK
jgi:hypothetical protein